MRPGGSVLTRAAQASPGCGRAAEACRHHGVRVRQRIQARPRWGGDVCLRGCVCKARVCVFLFLTTCVCV
ncbi:hypothetical protein NDU88_012144 [Pleurodeles waltl]|uniref:Uncharacterized protein n=1 Tax=Pleurodeles waltl TaxID=8319 RepID=A0AAV7QZU5_PLEWA|nr:hypothetical protein NDU88_012144 [Pleurodeles waltl]